MKFRVLGPLEMCDNGESVPIQGTKQRAVLGFLLLNTNRVVSTSALMDALWPMEEAPNTARKILHNAIWGLRVLLNERQDAEGRPSLSTRPPGYVLQLDPESVDLCKFQRFAKEGRTRLAEGSAAGTAALLREAVGLWRGAALADLVEEGYAWPELAGLENTRVDVLEDYFDAELALGRHHSVLREIESEVETGTLRERLCGQLMLALYRGGRHTDALGVYNRVRSRLVDQLGLEPGRGLQQLQQSILRHDDSLLVPQARREAVELVTEDRAPGASPLPTAAPPAVPAAPESPEPPEPSAAYAEPVRAVPDEGLTPALPPDGPRQPCSVVMMQAAVDFGAATDAASADRALAALPETLRHTADYFGGVMAAPAGPALLALFEGVNAAERAVSTALAMLAPGGQEEAPEQSVSIRATVVTGEVRTEQPDGGATDVPVLGGPLLDTSRTLMAHTAAGTVRACTHTRATTGGIVRYAASGGGAGGWKVRRVHWRSLTHPSIPIVDRDYELEVLAGLLGRSRHRSLPQTVTVLGNGGVGKTRVLLEFERRATASWEDVEFVVCGPEGADRPLGLLRNILTALCGAPDGSDAQTRAGLLQQIVYAWIAHPAEATELSAKLPELMHAGDEGPAPHRVDVLREAGCRLLRAVASDHPLVIFVDDGHELDDTSLDFLEQFMDSAEQLSIMLVLAARPSLLRRRPTWGRGQYQGATLTLPALADATIDQLSHILLAKIRQGQVTLPTRRIGQVIGDDGPRRRRRHALRTLMRLDTLLLPKPTLRTLNVDQVAVGRGGG